MIIIIHCLGAVAGFERGVSGRSKLPLTRRRYIDVDAWQVAARNRQSLLRKHDDEILTALKAWQAIIPEA